VRRSGGERKRESFWIGGEAFIPEGGPGNRTSSSLACRFPNWGFPNRGLYESVFALGKLAVDAFLPKWEGLAWRRTWGPQRVGKNFDIGVNGGRQRGVYGPRAWIRYSI
jgi:hypothetical protein